MSLDKRKKSKKGERIKNEGRKYIKVTKDPKANVKQIEIILFRGCSCTTMLGDHP